MWDFTSRKWAERRAGEILVGMEKQGPGEYQRLHDVTVSPKLSDLGITRMQSHRWQAGAGVSEKKKRTGEVPLKFNLSTHPVQLANLGGESWQDHLNILHTETYLPLRSPNATPGH